MATENFAPSGVVNVDNAVHSKWLYGLCHPGGLLCSTRGVDNCDGYNKLVSRVQEYIWNNLALIYSR